MGPHITLNSTLTTGPFILLFGLSASHPISSPLAPQLNLKESTVSSFIRSSDLDNTAPICLSLSSSLEPRNYLHKYSNSSQVDSSVSKFDHRTNTSATTLLFFFVSLLSKISIGSILIWPPVPITGNVPLTLLCCPWYFLSCETWKTGWMVDPAGKFNLYATAPIFLNISKGP
jgi:hypothetical protein